MREERGVLFSNAIGLRLRSPSHRYTGKQPTRCIGLCRGGDDLRLKVARPAGKPVPRCQGQTQAGSDDGILKQSDVTATHRFQRTGADTDTN